MLLGEIPDYLTATLMLGACGIFDLFWRTLRNAGLYDNPAQTFTSVFPQCIGVLLSVRNM